MLIYYKNSQTEKEKYANSLNRNKHFWLEPLGFLLLGSSEAKINQRTSKTTLEQKMMLSKIHPEFQQIHYFVCWQFINSQVCYHYDGGHFEHLLKNSGICFYVSLCLNNNQKCQSHLSLAFYRTWISLKLLELLAFKIDI